jgi:hypothetical protein
MFTILTRWRMDVNIAPAKTAAKVHGYKKFFSNICITQRSSQE